MLNKIQVSGTWNVTWLQQRAHSMCWSICVGGRSVRFLLQIVQEYLFFLEVLTILCVGEQSHEKRKQNVGHLLAKAVQLHVDNKRVLHWLTCAHLHYVWYEIWSQTGSVLQLLVSVEMASLFINSLDWLFRCHETLLESCGSQISPPHHKTEICQEMDYILF